MTESEFTRELIRSGRCPSCGTYHAPGHAFCDGLRGAGDETDDPRYGLPGGADDHQAKGKAVHDNPTERRAALQHKDG